jgi:hypothetical protein
MGSRPWNFRKMVRDEVEAHKAKRASGAEKESAEQQVDRYFELEAALVAGRIHFPKGYRAPFDKPAIATFEAKLRSSGIPRRAIKYIVPRIKSFVKQRAIESGLETN